MTRSCNHCGAVLPRPARFCPRCGRPARRVARPWLVLLALAAVIFFLIFISNAPRRHYTVPVMPRPMPPHVTLPDAWPLETPAAPRHEITDNPSILLDRNISASQLSLYGVKLLDSRTQIPRSKIRSSSGSDIRCIDQNAFSISNDLVARIALADPQLLSRLPIRESNDIARRLGNPDLLEASSSSRLGSISTYSYASRGLSFRFDERLGRLDQITLTLPSAARTER